MKILVVFGHLHRGGAETMYINLYRKMQLKDIQIDFLVKEHVSNGYEQEIETKGGRIFAMNSPKKIGILRFLRNLCSTMKKNGPYDVVHCHTNVFSGLILLAATLSGIKKRIVHSHSTRFDGFHFIVLTGKILIRLFATDRIACGMEAGKALFGRKPFSLLPNGIDISAFQKDNEKKIFYREKLNLDKKKKYIIHVGRFVEVKNHTFIIRMFTQLCEKRDDFHLLLCGDGPLKDSIEHLAASLGINKSVTFVGNIPNVNEYYIASDLFILPSFYEGMPVSGIEAQCSSLYCLFSDAITKEADFKLGRVIYLPLNEKKWVDEINKLDFTLPPIEISRINKAFEHRGYDVASNAKKMLNHYESRK